MISPRLRLRLRRRLAFLSLAALVAGCAPSAGEPDTNPVGGAGGKADDPSSCTPDEQMVELAPALGGLTFASPVALVPAPGDDARWYVVERRGVVWRVDTGGASPSAALFADLRARVNAGPGEAGLLGMALSPDFATDGRVYLSYTAPSSSSPVNLRSRLSRVLSRDGGLTADLSTEEILFSVDQPFTNHNGGHVAFGPDRLLYFGLGDGGSGGDPGNRAQNLSTPLGKLLRIDVSGAQGYQIPPDNPFAGGGGLPEIYAWGLRNPWRFSFDDDTGRLWLGDVGQDRFEEIDLVTRGGNYGWRIREGTHCFTPPSGCKIAGLTPPVAEYGHDEGVSVTGGFAYRGAAIPALAGQYLFGDFGSGRLWTLAEEAGGGFTRRLVGETSAGLASFAEGNDGELYAVDLAGGVYRIVPRTCGGGEPDAGPVGGTSFRDIYADIISSRCSPCHTASSSGGLSMPNAETAFENLVGADATSAACAGGERVVAGDPAASVLYRKVSGEDLCGPRMPLGGVLPDAQIEAIRQWIADGAQF